MRRARDHFLALDLHSKCLLPKIVLLLGYYRAALLVTSFKRLTASLHHYRDEPALSRATEQQTRRAAHLAYLVAGVARFTPWQSRCLVQVLTLRHLMAAEKLGGRFYLGVYRESASGDLSAHAWLRCGTRIVNGERGHERFTVVSVFSWLES